MCLDAPIEGLVGNLEPSRTMMVIAQCETKTFCSKPAGKGLGSKMLVICVEAQTGRTPFSKGAKGAMDVFPLFKRYAHSAGPAK